jgi:hypothetical protein
MKKGRKILILAFKMTSETHYGPQCRLFFQIFGQIFENKVKKCQFSQKAHLP